MPYIILSNISLTTGAAIHLTSMILAHRGPEQLLQYLPPGKMPPLPDIGGRCNGLIWLPNGDLSDLGHRMLDSAETLRQFASEMHPEEDQAHREGKLPRDLEGVNLMDFMEQRRQHAKLNVEYTRIIKRARIEALRAEGVHAAELWSTALQMITTSRMLLMDGSKRGAEEQPESENEQESTAPAESFPEPVLTQDGELATSAPSNHTSISMPSSTLQTQAQTQSVTPSNPVLGSNSSRGYAPFNCHAVEHESLLPSYPVHAPQSMPGAYPSYDHAFTTGSVGGPWSLDPVSGILYDEQGRPVNTHSQEYIQTSDYEAYVYSTSVEEPMHKGPFQPGGATFDVNFPALSGSSESRGPGLGSGPGPIEPPMEKLPVTPPQPQRAQQQRHQRQRSRADHANRTEKRTSIQGQEKPRNLFHRLPLHVNCQIIARRAGAEGILSLAQQERLVKYATDWNSIAAEMRAQGAEEHQQIWKILDSVNCFIYPSSS